MRFTVPPPDDDELVNLSLLYRPDLFLNYQNSFHEVQGSLSSSEVASSMPTGGYSYYPHTAQSSAYPDATISTPLGLEYREQDRSSQFPIFDGMPRSIVGEYNTTERSSPHNLNNRYDFLHASPASFVASMPLHQQANLDQDSIYVLYDEEHPASDGVVSSEVNSSELLHCFWEECMHLPTFSHNESLLKHIKSEHINPQCHANREHKKSAWQCNWKDCASSSALSKKALLVRHVKTLHVEPDAFSCGICGKCFNRKDNLIGHQRKHHQALTA